jgi:LuxR family transcriptional regulator, maltose regulon positive regulatory protein
MLLTKLHIPPPSQNIVHRSELYEKLNIGLTHKLILISAPAGFGKTTLISDWISQQKIPAAWFSIDNGDNDPVEFLSYIISGIQSIHSPFGQAALSLLNSPNKPSDASIASMLINEIINIDQDFLLVLDDFHLIESPDILKLVAYFLEHIPDNIHIVILTRSDPALSVARLRSQHQLVELRSNELSFSANDISILFNKKLKLGLSIDDIYSLETKTEGWIAGLQLTALSMQGREDITEFIQNLKGDNRYIMDYLIEEVLKLQTDDIKDFLIRTSLLEQLSAPLCNAVLNRNDSQFILEKLEKDNMFVIPLDDDRTWYRYHHLFAQLLKQRLQLHDKAVINAIHNKASDWFEYNNMNELAIDHTLAIKNYEKCLHLLSKESEGMWQNGMHTAILKYGDMLPHELIKTNPEFCLYYSWILISAGQIQRAEPFLASAELLTKNTIQGNNLTEENIRYQKKLLGKISVAFAYMNSHEEQSEKTFSYCKTAMENLSEDDPLWFSWAWFSYGVSYFSIGELPEGSKAFDNALEYGKKSGNIYLISAIVIRMAENEQQLGHYKSAYRKCTDLLTYMKERGFAQIAKAEWTFASLYLIMGITESMWANIEKAFEYVKIAYNLSREASDIYLRIMILMIYSSLLAKIGDGEADKKMHELDDIMRQNEVPPFLISMYITWKTFYFLEQNQIEEASNLFTEYGIGLDKKITHVYEMCYVMYTRLLLAQGKLNEAEGLISELYGLVSAGQRIERMIELKVISTDLYKRRGDRKNAIKSLMFAMEIAAEENLLSYFVLSFVDIDDLFEEVFKIHATSRTNIPKKFIDNIKLALEKRKQVKKINFETILSARELDTLKLMTQELSNQEIADKLFISLNTVKTHLKNIYFKLEVDNRSKAVARAKELRIV